MNRLRLALLAVSGFGLIAASLFIVENEVQGLKEDLNEIHRQLRADREAIHVMQAEWAYLTQPARIALLTKQNLPDLVPQQSKQYYSIEGAAMALNRVNKETESAALPVESGRVVQ